MADDDGPIVLGVSECFQIEGLEDGAFPTTVEVRDQLAELLNASPGRKVEALSTAIMTTVMNLELAGLNRETELIGVKTELRRLASNTMDAYVTLIELRTELIRRGVISPTPTPEIDWFPVDPDDDVDGD
ncbi:hypothetical protein [Mycolicibacterium sp.]|uniref:hypothetical protein n=1 Tax=Mycolicibacterium sp. TaxID=2320850 RepID=UPI0037C8715F